MKSTTIVKMKESKITRKEATIQFTSGKHFQRNSSLLLSLERNFDFGPFFLVFLICSPTNRIHFSFSIHFAPNREVLLDRYVIIQKLGWGHFSTVWLAKDFKFDTYVAIKIQKSAPHYLEAAYDEVEILQHVTKHSEDKEWLDSLRDYYADVAKNLKNFWKLLVSNRTGPEEKVFNER